jgi:membrane associated rhomboid family serine protease
MRTYRAVNLNVLWFLIALNVVIFVITLARPEETIYFLGLTPALLSKHPWTIISSMFVHDPRSFIHILFNMIGLYFLGSFLIRAVGEKSFLAVFFLGGLAGNILYFVLGHLVLRGLLPPPFGHPFTPGIGASGGIFALGGALAVMVPRVPVFIFFIPVPIPLWVAIVIFFFLSFLPGIAWQAHVGGLLLGLAAGLIFRRRRRTYYF